MTVCWLAGSRELAAQIDLLSSAVVFRPEGAGIASGSLRRAVGLLRNSESDTCELSARKWKCNDPLVVSGRASQPAIEKGSLARSILAEIGAGEFVR